MAAGGDGWTTVARVSDIPAGSLKRVIARGREVAIANVNGKFYAIVDRCGHMNAPFSRGSVRDVGGVPIVTCPLHGSTFDAATGHNLSGPVKSPPVDMTGTPSAVLESLARAAELSALIRVYDVASLPVQVQGEEIRVRA